MEFKPPSITWDGKVIGQVETVGLRPNGEIVANMVVYKDQLHLLTGSVEDYSIGGEDVVPG